MKAKILVVLSFLVMILPAARAEDILFFGNSFTSVNDIPKLMEAIATSKGKTATIMAVTKGGQGWPYHLSKPAADAALQSKAWNWVVLQDYSLNATHARKVDEFMKTGQQFYDRIAKLSPSANILLYETWAYSRQNPAFAATSSAPSHFSSPEEMYGEIHKNYAALQTVLQAKDPKRKVLIAPVGTAFAKCVREHPEIDIYAKDFKHPSLGGSYLSASVIYATLFSDSPVGAAPGKKGEPKDAKILQQVAEETVKAFQTGK